MGLDANPKHPMHWGSGNAATLRDEPGAESDPKLGSRRVPDRFRSGHFRSGHFRFRSGQVRSGQVRSLQVQVQGRLGQGRQGKARQGKVSGQPRSGQVRAGKVRRAWPLPKAELKAGSPILPVV